MTTALTEIMAAAGGLSDSQVMDAIILIDHECPKGDAGAEHRLVRAALYTVMETRYPFLDEAMEAWANDMDDHLTYTEAMIDALHGFGVMV